MVGRCILHAPEPTQYIRSEDGDPYSVITQIAHDVSADAIVVGASTRLGHRIAGSLAVRLDAAARFEP